MTKRICPALTVTCRGPCLPLVSCAMDAGPRQPDTVPPPPRPGGVLQRPPQSVPTRLATSAPSTTNTGPQVLRGSQFPRFGGRGGSRLCGRLSDSHSHSPIPGGGGGRGSQIPQWENRFGAFLPPPCPSLRCGLGICQGPLWASEPWFSPEVSPPHSRKPTRALPGG